MEKQDLSSRRQWPPAQKEFCRKAANSTAILTPKSPPGSQHTPLYKGGFATKSGLFLEKILRSGLVASSHHFARKDFIKK
jgi:hypothetical protein